MPVLSSRSRQRVDRIAATVGVVAFAAGVAAIAWGAIAQPAAGAIVTSTQVSSPVPGPATTETVLSTTPPLRPTSEPRVTQDVTVTEGGGAGSVVVTTAPTAGVEPFLGSTAASLAFQLALVTFAALLLAFGTQRVLLGEYGVRRSAASADLPVIDEEEAAAVKRGIAAAGEAADLSRPLFERAPVTDPRLRLLQNRIALELEVRNLAQHNDLPSGLTLPYVMKGLVGKKRMSVKLATAISELNTIGDRLARGAEISLDTTTLLTEAYAQALAKVGGRIK